ncbi:MAG TPA: DEAD/DEAH box helicase, partial [Microthrixaceae bacterium]|nr:DEAD/DEAH box helicase [Microthrixaceae bacterium]
MSTKLNRGSEELSITEMLDLVIAAIPDGEERVEQRDMAEAVREAFESRRHLAVQGPTGVGKSIAYLIPAIAAAAKGRRTVIVTSSKALQDQLAAVELPFLQSVLPQPFSFAVLKGRSNYLCEAAASEVRIQISGMGQQGLDLGSVTATGDLDLSEDELKSELDEILEWAEVTMTGDMAELPTTPHWRSWSSVSVGPGECIGAAKCSYASKCWSELARASADEADILVVNAHLYGAHIQTGGSLLPEHSQLVIDEAHEFEDSIVGSLSIELTPARLENLLRIHRRCVAEDDKVVKALRSAAEGLEDSLAAVGAMRLRDGLTKELAAAVATASSASDRALNSLKMALRSAGASSAKHKIETAIRTADALVVDTAALLGKMQNGSVL